MDTLREDEVKTHREDSYLQAKNRGLRRHNPDNTVTLDFWTPRLKKLISVVYITRSMVPYFGSSSKLIH